VYESFFGFREKPFNLTPDPKYLYLSGRHTEAFAHLSFGHREKGGFVVITGEVGTGKTTLARSFLAKLGAETATAVVLYPALTAAELLRSTLDDLHVAAAGDSLKELVDALHRFLLEARQAGRTVVLLIDEAQDLATDVLEQIRLLSNLETDTEKLIQIVLMGQSELVELLGRRELRQLAQRVTARYHLTPLSRAETEGYIRHRLEVAGGAGTLVFTPGAIAAVHAASGGVPRLINLLCDRALLAGYARGTRTLDADLVRLAAREVRGSAPALLTRQGVFALGGGLALAAAVAAALYFPSAASAPLPEPAAAPALRAAAPLPTPAAGPALDASRQQRFLELMAGAPREASTEQAFRRLHELWGEGPLERTSLRANADQLRRLDLPGVLEMFHPRRPESCSLLLLSLDGETALVSVMGETLQLPWSQVDALWTRQVTVAWRDFDKVGGDAARVEPWLRERLLALGYAKDGQGLSDSVTLFQRDQGLVMDGVVGARTLMALYARGEHARPRLRRSAS
jgi:general secretion pathway protein A